MKAIMETEDVRYRYPGIGEEALSGLSMQIPEGRKVAICGANGCGKSTLFLHAIGILRPTSGRVKWRGQPVGYDRASLGALRRRVGLVFQDPEHQLILNTPREDISYGLRNLGLAEAEIRERADRIVEKMGLADLAGLPTHHLSLGQKKRVALAGVLALKPELLLLDEATAYLDRRSERALLAELDDACRRGVTVAMATHDMNVAYSWADWVLVMDKGRCAMAGPPHEVFSREEEIQALGLELPLLYEVWKAMPEELRAGFESPRSLEAFKEALNPV
ncbi:ABC transporter ATP-binding protein [Cohnella xylanilytica]|uniref:ABC transporter ATP-binding protein n=1 Tax=Cohnella xylanilytica TaxID=557555 RepID=A0A841UAD6_9BACL|nr:ABC transporter ATP-binding protein [Cohnella xylanilytica]MBB6694931.1 ABC transporter ATP-binding protein [Cohnella xylanilytica]